MQSVNQKKNIKNRRRYLRAPFNGSVIAHDNQKIFQGRCTNVSVLGLSFYADKEIYPVGTQINLHVKPGAGLTPFNAICEVVSAARIINSKEPGKTSVKYGVRFLKIPQQTQEEIHRLTQKQRQSAAA